MRNYSKLVAAKVEVRCWEHENWLLLLYVSKSFLLSWDCYYYFVDRRARVRKNGPNSLPMYIFSFYKFGVRWDSDEKERNEETWWLKLSPLNLRCSPGRALEFVNSINRGVPLFSIFLLFFASLFSFLAQTHVLPFTPIIGYDRPICNGYLLSTFRKNFCHWNLLSNKYVPSGRSSIKIRVPCRGFSFLIRPKLRLILYRQARLFFPNRLGFL